MDATIPERQVKADDYQIVSEDVILSAELHSSLVVCLYDEVEQDGALLHLRLAAPGQSRDPNLTDNTLIERPGAARSCAARTRRRQPASPALAGEAGGANRGSGIGAGALRRPAVLYQRLSAGCADQGREFGGARGEHASACAFARRWASCARRPDRSASRQLRRGRPRCAAGGIWCRRRRAPKIRPPSRARPSRDGRARPAGNGLRAIACPTARAAPGLPARAASSP